MSKYPDLIPGDVVHTTYTRLGFEAASTFTMKAAWPSARVAAVWPSARVAAVWPNFGARIERIERDGKVIWPRPQPTFPVEPGDTLVNPEYGKTHTADSSQPVTLSPGEFIVREGRIVWRHYTGEPYRGMDFFLLPGDLIVRDDGSEDEFPGTSLCALVHLYYKGRVLRRGWASINFDLPLRIVRQGVVVWERPS